ncbi:MAG: NHLP bacteriocin system secretion protein [Salinarimonadaceae bacterium]|nr:MAG: NHLP bacteriocin system secretion protein [Salinarimonadaceae bacterium]
MSDGFFRQQAVDAQRRIDNLPSAMRVTTGLTRTAMVLLGITLSAAVVWSAFVEVPVQINGNGVFVDTSGELLNPVRAPMEGVVEAILVNEGDYVSQGQVVARLRLPDRIASLKKAQRNLAALREKAEQTRILQEAEAETEAKVRAVRRLSLEERISNLERQLASQQKLEQGQITLMERRITTAVRLHEAEVATQAVANELAAARSDLSALLVEPLLKESARKRERLEEANAISQAESEILALRTELQRGTELRSPVHGLVAELSVERNGLVGAGQPVMSIIPENFDKVLDAITYVSLSDGKLVNIGDQVYLRPLSMPTREQGRIRGTVMEISEAPITEQALTRTLGNTALAEQTANGGAPFAVRVALHRDPTTPSGYAWTSGDGPDMRLSPGTPLSSRITVERETLLTIALPALQRFFGADEGGWSALAK